MRGMFSVGSGDLEDDSKAIFKASSLAWKARCFLLGEEE